MNKFKAFGIAMSSMLILGTASSTIVAVAESVDESVEVEVNKESENFGEVFRNLKSITFDSSSLSQEQIKALEGFKKDTYRIKMDANGSTTYIGFNEVDEKTINHFENQKVLTLALNENVATTVDIALEDLNGQALEKQTAMKISEEAAINDPVSEVDKDQQESDSIPEPSYTPKEYNTEEQVSLPRSSEIDELLHGGNNSIGLYSGIMRPSSSYLLNEDEPYTVKSGDTFYTIASLFRLSSRQLREWNKHISNINSLKIGTKLAVTRRGVEALLSDADKERLHRGGTEPVYTIPQEFIDDIAPQAINVSNQNGEEPLWPSLMIAQAAHESNYGRSSLASPPYHNLSGIKGSHNGKSVLMWTWEVLSGSKVYVLAPFRHYPSYDASLQSYARLLRKGLSWDRKYYAGTWRSNTNSVWDVLENGGLRGYATDPNYYAAIKRIINAYDLTQYDSGNYYVKTGTFFGEPAANNSIASMKTINSNLSYRYEKSAKTPYQNRRVETTNEFVGEKAAQKAVNSIKSDKGWYSNYRKTKNSTKHVRVQSGYFNSRERAEKAVEEFKEESGLYATIEKGLDGKYRLRTGYFVGEESARKNLENMKNIGWFAKIIETGESTPHYVVYTGVFPNPSAVKSAHEYFNQSHWNSKETGVNKKTYFYRVYVEGFPYETQASSFVNELQNQFGWYSSAFPVK